ncbi:MAG: MFS transporter, partial [Pseudomonadota bacterium]
SVILTLGFRALWIGGAGVLLLVTLPLIYLLLSQERTPRIKPGEASESQSADPRHWRRRDVLREPAFWALLLGILAPAFMMTCLFFHQLHLVEIKSWSPVVFAFGFMVFAITQVGAAFVVGFVIDTFSARFLLPVMLLPMGVGLWLPFLFQDAAIVFALMFLLGLTGGTASAIMGALWPELFGAQFLGEIRALAYSAMVVSSAASPFITGYLIDAGIAFPLQLAVMGGYCLLASALMGLIQPRLAAIVGPKDPESIP